MILIIHFWPRYFLLFCVGFYSIHSFIHSLSVASVAAASAAEVLMFCNNHQNLSLENVHENTKQDYSQSSQCPKKYNTKL